MKCDIGTMAPRLRGMVGQYGFTSLGKVVFFHNNLLKPAAGAPRRGRRGESQIHLNNNLKIFPVLIKKSIFAFRHSIADNE
jgi:hypothetical protein